MNTKWQPGPLARPDPYLDWEYRTRPAGGDDLFCSVQVQIIPAIEKGKKHYLPSLYLLLKAVQDGRQQDDDDVTPHGVTIRMIDEELVHLGNTIKRIEHDGDVPAKIDKIEVQFFIYRRESVIYYKGDYRNPAFYDVIMVGPPIDGLSFNERSDAPEPLDFGEPLVTAETVAIGIIDDGIAFGHQRFRSGPDSTRIQGLWLQEIERPRIPDKGVLFGKRFSKDEIDQQLKTCKTEGEVYRQVGAVDFGSNEYNPLAARASHGTHVLDLASGFDTNQPRRPIFAVQLPSVATIDTSGVTMGSYVLQAVRLIMLWADSFGKRGVPLVINFSYGLLAGPKDGTQQLEKALFDLVHFRNKKKHLRTRLVMPAGNSYRTRAAARMKLKPSVERDVDWIISPDDQTASFVEIWLDASAGKLSPVEVTLTPPQQSSGCAVQPETGEMYTLTVDGHLIAGLYYHVFGSGKDRRERIMIAISPTARNEDSRDLAPSGRWNVSICNKVQQAITAHLYVQRDDTPFGYPRRGRQSRLDHEDAYTRDNTTGDYREPGPHCPITHQETLSSIATCSPSPGDHTIVVGAAEASEHYPPADYTASGPTKLRAGPDCSAIADDGAAHRGVLAAGTLSGTMVAMNGTSVAAPRIVREVANGLEAMNTSADTATSAGGKPGTSAVSASGPVTIPVSKPNKARLGEFLLLPEENAQTLKRRYPANP